MEYQILKANISYDLQQAVNEAIADGWKPYGSLAICIIPQSSQALYAQAMIKEKIYFHADGI